MKPIQTAGVIGLGSLGVLYATLFTRALGKEQVPVLADGARIARYRKQGYAGELLKRMIAEARKEGRKGLVLTCKDPLVHYYAKFGFVNEGFLGSTRGGVTWNQMRITF